MTTLPISGASWKVRCASAAAVSLAHEAIKKQMQGRQTAVASSRIYFTVLKLEWKKEATQSQVLHYLKDHLHRESDRHPNPASANSQCALAKWKRVNSQRADITSSIYHAQEESPSEGYDAALKTTCAMRQ